MQRRVDASYYFEVRVRSQSRPNLIRIAIVERNAEYLGKHIAVAAGALAEQLNERYHDSIEPSAAAQTALECYNELMAFPKVEEGDEPPANARLAGN